MLSCRWSLKMSITSDKDSQILLLNKCMAIIAVTLEMSLYWVYSMKYLIIYLIIPYFKHFVCRAFTCSTVSLQCGVSTYLRWDLSSSSTTGPLNLKPRPEANYIKMSVFVITYISHNLKTKRHIHYILLKYCPIDMVPLFFINSKLPWMFYAHV